MLKFTAQNVDDPQIPIAVGIVVGLIASFIQSLGLTIQRKSHVLNQQLPESEQKVEHRRPLWLLGFGIFISSNLFGSVFQIASLPVVILAPLGAVSLLWNAFFARLILGDVFSPWMVLSTLCIAGGAVLIAVFGIVPEPTHSLEDLLALFNRPAFIVYFSLLGVFTLVSLVITHAVEYSSSRRIALPADTPPLSPLLAPLGDPTILTNAGTIHTSNPEPDNANEGTPLIDHKVSRPASLASLATYISASKTPLFLAMSYASFSGIISGMCLLLAKSGIELLVLTIAGKNQFFMWQSWALVLGLVVCALLQLWYMHKSLVLADPTLVCPLAFCFYNLSSIINGLVYFDQFGYLSTAHLLLVVLGIVILLAGVWIVSFPPGGTQGIDVGTWGEEGESGSSVGDAEHLDHYEDEPLPMTSSQIISQDETIGMERVSGTTSPVAPQRPISLDEISEPNGHSPPRVSHLRRLTEPALPSGGQSTGPQSTESPTSPTLSSSRRRPPVTTHNTLGHHLSSSRQSFPPHPLSPGAPSGFSIGLSPVSPGFALIPRERRRRRRVTSAESDPEFLGQVASRRVVSDSSIVHDGTSGDAGGEVGGQDISPRTERDIEAAGLRIGGGSRSRWKWLPRLLAPRDRPSS
ncbi:hypothetical protein BDW22DRAFT_1385129 [Trametopsis cervina]|nr:hypothetical protein BDW22DRAFT_1385129 [Trametopsis cervina]